MLGEEGNAALAMNVLGSPAEAGLADGRATEARGVDPADAPPRLLPAWWQIGVVQAFVALVVVGIWRGRRLGPILSERLPVRVRAAETVEGHGRLYYRLNARDQAAEALRAGPGSGWAGPSARPVALGTPTTNSPSARRSAPGPAATRCQVRLTLVRTAAHHR